MEMKSTIIWTLVIFGVAWKLDAEQEIGSELPVHADRPQNSPSATIQPEILDYDQLQSDSRDVGPHKRYRRSISDMRIWLGIGWAMAFGLAFCCKCCLICLKQSDPDHDGVVIATQEQEQQQQIQFQQLQPGQAAVIGEYPAYTLANPSACSVAPPPEYTVTPPLGYPVAPPPPSSIAPPSYTEAMNATS